MYQACWAWQAIEMPMHLSRNTLVPVVSVSNANAPTLRQSATSATSVASSVTVTYPARNSTASPGSGVLPNISICWLARLGSVALGVLGGGGVLTA